MRSGFLQRAARRVVPGYPPPWRERYEGELLALLDDSPVRLRDVIDLARGMVVERARSLFEPGDRPTLVTTLVFVAGFVRAVALAAPPILAGWAAQEWLGPVPRSVRNVTFLVGVLFLFVLTIRLRRESPSATNPSERKRLSSRGARVYLGLAIPITFLLSWTATHLMHYVQLLWLFSPVWDRLGASRPWQAEMARAVHQLRIGRDELRWALLELDRCERLVADGSPAPLQEARDAVEWLTRQRDEALAMLHSLGYRASLTRPGFGDA